MRSKMEIYISGTGQKIMVHDSEKCKGRNCCIHNPSNHHMKNWPTNWREDRYLMERICEHGIGHPDPDDLSFKKSKGMDIKYDSIHGCDGCCNPIKK